MSTAELIVGIILMISAIIMIVSVLMQQSKQQGLGAIGGGDAESFFGKSKGLDSKLAMITKVSSAIFIVLSLVMVIISK
ncbi:MAG: preprotein translocase subunit SecG [Eubacteriales bacterium]|nr:preprotein translocase subunit SecG [Eubacteriales bacterium]